MNVLYGPFLVVKGINFTAGQILAFFHRAPANGSLLRDRSRAPTIEIYVSRVMGDWALDWASPFDLPTLKKQCVVECRV